jgi:hypothetical protein
LNGEPPLAKYNVARHREGNTLFTPPCKWGWGDSTNMKILEIFHRGGRRGTQRRSGCIRRSAKVGIQPSGEGSQWAIALLPLDKGRDD